MDSAIVDNSARSRFELPIDSHIAYAVYEIDADTITLTHTVVPRELEGRGIASRLIEHALTQAKARGKKVVPQCPFVAAYIRKHPQWAALLA